MVTLINIIKEEIEINEQLKKKVIWACSFNNTSPIIKNGSLLKLVPTNVAYVEPHRITINDKLYLLFNGCDYAFIGNLNFFFNNIYQFNHPSFWMISLYSFQLTTWN